MSEESEEQESRIVPVKIEDELKTSFLDYSMSVIMARALPDVRDGLKPSQRRILVAMDDLNLAPNRGYRKCAKIAGDTSGNYHPHGEAIVYPTLVHMAQSFRMRYPLVDGQGNFGSIDGYPPAAMRYTEARMSYAATEMLGDLEKDTVEYMSNYDDTQSEPVVLPSKFPNLICNGSMGIAVGMATKIPPHNIREIVEGLKVLIENPDSEISDLTEHIKAPDFPTGGVIYGMSGVQQAYRTGRGIVHVRARADVEELKNGREQIVVTEIPFLVNKSTLLQKIADLVRDKTIDGLSNIRDESGRKGMRIVFEVKRDAQAEVVLNQLFQHSMLQNTYGVMMLAIVNGRPELLNLKQMLQHYIDHRHEVIMRRTRFDLQKAEARAHILAGMRFALDHIDWVIETIRSSANPETAKKRLVEGASLELSQEEIADLSRISGIAGQVLSEIQAQSILTMPLQRLTGLEREKIDTEFGDLEKSIADYKDILENRSRQMNIIKEDLDEMVQRFGDDRRTEIVYAAEEFDIEDLIAEEDMVVTISHEGYIKRMSPRAYRVQNRGGRGVTSMKTKDEDFVQHLFVASTHAYLMFLTSNGKCHWLKVYRIPEGERTARGRPLVNVLKIEPEDQICAIVAVREFSQDQYLFTATRKGIVKKSVLSAYGNIRRDGIIALKIQEEDDLIGAAIIQEGQDIVLATRRGRTMRFAEKEVRKMGRVSTGVKGISLKNDDEVVSMVVVSPNGGQLLTLCENGYGKRTNESEYPSKHRGGVGVIDIKTSERNGATVACKEVSDDDEVMIVTQKGVLIRTAVNGISTVGRNTQGVRVINIGDGDRVIDMTPLPKQEEDHENITEDDRDANNGETADE